MATGASQAEEAGEKIVLHEKAFAHLTRGMYRSPASAIRELISNGWDARATNVRISTGSPSFTLMSIFDDGDGFDKNEFLRIVRGGLGNSEKRARQGARHNGRPTIGRLGIGLFGIAQICAAFTIASNPRKGKPFKAQISLYSLLKEELDKKDSKYLSKTDDDGAITEVQIGEFKLLEFDPTEFEGTGTRIVANVLHPVFTRTFREASKLKDGVPAGDWKSVLKQAAKYHSLQELGEYFRFVWELAASAPVPYLSDQAVPEGRIKTYQKDLIASDFHVFVDGLELFKPVWLKGNPNGYSTVAIPETSDTPFNRRIAFSGYIAVQEGHQLRPDELRGLLVRIKGVGIGLYDPSLLDYRFNEGPRSRWITGEIFVDDGLEDALNVDRDSFNRFHPHFRFLQKIVHELLREQLMPSVYRKLKQRSTSRAETRRSDRQQALQSTIKESFSARVTEKKKGDETVIVVRASQRGGSKSSVSIAAESEEDLDTKKTNKQLASGIMAIYDVASLEPTSDRRREAFKAALLKLLREW